MSQIRSDILYQRQKKDGQTNRQIKQLHIATPIILDHFDEGGNYNSNDLQNIEEDLFASEDQREGTNDNSLVNEGELIDSDPEENVNHWDSIIAHWKEEVNQESQFGNSNDESLLSEDLDNDFLVGAYSIHPADNSNFKWELSSIFINDLEPPSCFHVSEMI
jgi:hypothetical protein